VLVYAASAIFLNHAFLPWGGRAGLASEPRITAIAISDEPDGLSLAKQVQQQLGVRGEIGYVSRNAKEGRLNFPIESPGHVTNVQVDLATHQATITRRETGIWDATIYLHKMPGPHNAAIRGNWIFTRAWSWLADASVYGILFLSLTGVYLWAVLKAERKAGLLFFGAGIFSFSAIVLAVVA